MVLLTSPSLHIDIDHRNFQLTDRQEKYVREKLDHLKHYASRVADESSKCRVEFRENKLRSAGNRIFCEVTLSVPRAVIRAEVAGLKVEEALDLAIDKLKRQIERYKGRWNNWDKKGEKFVRDMKEALHAVTPPSEDEFGLPSLVTRRKHSDVRTMKESEAIEQMELVGHDFFLFQNVETDRLAVVYKREDGTYGLLEPNVKK